MQMQLDAVQTQRGMPMGSDCLCPPVCFQYPPPFCLPCGPGPSSAPDGAGDCMPPPRQCGPFLMLNTPMERKMVMLPMMDGQRPHERQGIGRSSGQQHRHDADCCDDAHHHHHGDPEEQECCDEPHHHHHHHNEDQGRCKLRKGGKNAKRERDGSGSSVSRASRRSSRGRGGHDDDDSDDGQAVRAKQAKKENVDEIRQNRREKKRAMVRSARTNSRELRAGKLYIGCDCEKRNGLQDDCQRSLCQGSPECTTMPPTCAPSAFSNGKHLSARREAFEKKLREAFKNC